MARLARRIRTLRSLSWPHRIALFESAALFWFFVAALKVVPFRRFKRVLGPDGPKHDPTEIESSRAETGNARLVSRGMRRLAVRHPDTCLAQALAGRVMLRRRKLASLISFGVRQGDSGGFEFHAWLVHDGCLITGHGALREFSVLSTFYDEPR